MELQHPDQRSEYPITWNEKVQFECLATSTYAGEVGKEDEAASGEVNEIDMDDKKEYDYGLYFKLNFSTPRRT